MRPAHKRENSPAECVRTQSGASAFADGEAIVLAAPSGAVLLRYHSDTGALELCVERGDLRLSAPSGKIVLDSAEGVEITAPKTAIRSTELSLELGRMNVAADRIIEKAREVYRDTEELVHQRAGRLRTLVREGYQLMAGRVRVNAEKEVALDGERILLG